MNTPEIDDLESIVEFTEKTHVNIYEVLKFYFEAYRKNQRNAYMKTMQFIYQQKA